MFQCLSHYFVPEQEENPSIAPSHVGFFEFCPEFFLSPPPPNYQANYQLLNIDDPTSPKSAKSG